MRLTLLAFSVILTVSEVYGFHFPCSTLQNSPLKGRFGVVAFEKADSRDVGSRKGFYIRPSAAIEKGGGFFIPGLDGDKLQIVISCGILFLLAANRFPGYDAEPSQLVSESIAALVSFGVLLTLFSQNNDDSRLPPTALFKFSYCADTLSNKMRVLCATESLLDLSGSGVALLFGKNHVLTCIGEFEESHFILDDGGIEKLNMLIADAAGNGEFRVLRRSVSNNNDLFAAMPSACGSVAVLPLAIGNHFWLIGTPSQGWTERQLFWLESIGKFTAQCLIESV